MKRGDCKTFFVGVSSVGIKRVDCKTAFVDIDRVSE